MRHARRNRGGMDGREAARLLYGRRPGEDGGEGRVPFDRGVDFYELRRRAMIAGKEVGRPFGRLLSLLSNCEPMQRHEAEERRGASYKRLKFLGALCEFGERRQRQLYRLARRAGMSDRFAGHLISEVKTRLAARRAER